MKPAATQHLPVYLLAILLLIFVLTGYNPPAGRLNWFLEVLPSWIGIVVLIAIYPRLRFSNWVYVCVFLHSVILVYGGYYTYAQTPLGNWAKEVFDFSRNHYDRIGHLAVGLFPVFMIKEVLLRKTRLERGGWFIFIVLSIILAIAAFWELIEWWTVILVAPDVGNAYLGMQGDVWDAQWDMLLAIVGAAISLALFGRMHDTALERKKY